MRVKNVSGQTDVWVGQTILNNEIYVIPQQDLFRWQTDDKVITSVAEETLLIGTDSTFFSGPAEATAYLLAEDTDPKDQTGRRIIRTAATISGWHYQLLALEITTAKYQGYFCQDDQGNDLGFITAKIFDINNAEITSAQSEGNAVKTVIDVHPNHDYELIGSIFSQAEAPTTNIRLFSTGAPGISNIKFSVGGINLKQIGARTIQIADGRASKYIAYNAQYPAAHTLRYVLTYTQGVQHSFQIVHELFKAP